MSAGCAAADKEEVSYIDVENRALIYQMRKEEHSWTEILDEVVKSDGSTPSKSACQQIMKNWNKVRGEGRTGAPRKTTLEEDKLIISLMEKYRFKQYVDTSIYTHDGSSACARAALLDDREAIQRGACCIRRMHVDVCMAVCISRRAWQLHEVYVSVKSVTCT